MRCIPLLPILSLLSVVAFGCAAPPAAFEPEGTSTGAATASFARTAETAKYPAVTTFLRKKNQDSWTAKERELYDHVRSEHYAYRETESVDVYVGPVSLDDLDDVHTVFVFHKDSYPDFQYEIPCQLVALEGLAKKARSNYGVEITGTVDTGEAATIEIELAMIGLHENGFPTVTWKRVR